MEKKIQLILKEEQVEQIIDSLQKTGLTDLAAKMSGLMPKKPEMEFPFELEGGKGENICEAKGCRVYVSGKSREESLKRYGYVFCGSESEGHIGDIEGMQKKGESKKKVEREVYRGPIVKLPPGAEIKPVPERHERVVQQKKLFSEQKPEPVAKPVKTVEEHLTTMGELSDKCEDCGKFVPIGTRGFTWGKTGRVLCMDCYKEGTEDIG